MTARLVLYAACGEAFLRRDETADLPLPLLTITDHLIGPEWTEDEVEESIRQVARRCGYKHVIGLDCDQTCTHH